MNVSKINQNVFRKAKIEEIDMILTFLRENFPSRSLYYDNKVFFLKEFQIGEELAVWLAIKDNEIMAVCSYYLANQDHCPDIISGIWSAKKDAGPLIGLSLRKEMLQQHKPGVFVGTTSVESSLAAHRRFTKYIEPLTEYQAISENIKLKQGNLRLVMSANQIGELLKTDFDYENGLKKDVDYLARRYLNNPLFNFWMYTYECSLGNALVICRKKEKNREMVLEVIDYMGREEIWIFLLTEIKQIARERLCQRISFLQIGFSEEILCRAGFTKVLSPSADEKTVYAFRSKPVRMTIGDGVME